MRIEISSKCGINKIEGSTHTHIIITCKLIVLLCLLKIELKRLEHFHLDDTCVTIVDMTTKPVLMGIRPNQLRFDGFSLI